MGTLVRVMIVVLAAALGVALAYRMTAEAMAVVVGVLFGVLATIPVSLIVLTAARRYRGDSHRRDERPASPPVVVIQPPVAPVDQSRRERSPDVLPGAYWPPGSAYSFDPGPERDFRIIGDDE